MLVFQIALSLLIIISGLSLAIVGINSGASTEMLMSGGVVVLIGAYWMYHCIEESKRKPVQKTNFSPKERHEHWRTDTSLPEEERRKAMIESYIAAGWVIDRQEPGLITVRKPKGKFSMILFILLLLCWVAPALVYALWYAFQKDEIKQYTLEQ